MPSTARVQEIQSVLDSGNTARSLLGNALTLLHSAYGVTDSYQVGPLGSTVAGQNTEYLDGIRGRAEADYAKLPQSDDPLDSQTAAQVAFDIASIESATNQTLDILGGNTALGDLADGMKEGVTKLLGDLPNPLKGPPGGYWPWLIGFALLAIVLYLKPWK